MIDADKPFQKKCPKCKEGIIKAEDKGEKTYYKCNKCGIVIETEHLK